MVSNLPTFSIKMLGQRIHREYVPPLFVLAALFIALLLTYPAHTLFAGSLIYLTSLPVSAYRYLVAKRHADAFAKAQNGKGAEAETSNADRTETTRMSTDL
jgi:CDP-diacylglycerol--serine O-phosphatidyltransferase